MEKRVDLTLLLSFYGAMLTERQRDMLRLYYEDDLSLSEIAALSGVTRQGAHDLIRRGESQLLSLETKLGLRARWVRVCQGLERIKETMEAGETGQAIAMIDTLLREEEDRDGV